MIVYELVKLGLIATNYDVLAPSWPTSKSGVQQRRWHSSAAHQSSFIEFPTLVSVLSTHSAGPTSGSPISFPRA
jgi:hypothetical protein